MSIYRPGHFIAVHRSGHHVANLHPDAVHALNSMAATFPKNPLSPIPTMTPKTSPPMMNQVSPTMMAKTSPPIVQNQGFRPAPHTQVSAPTLQPQVNRRPVAHTQMTSPLPQSQAVRPVSYQQQQQQTNILSKFVSDTATQVVTNVITADIQSATLGSSGGGGGGSTSGGSIFGDTASYNGGSVDNAGSSFWSPLPDSTSDSVQSGGDSGGWCVGGDSGY